MTLSDEQIQDLLRVGNPTDDECRLIRMGWDAAMRTKSAPNGWKLVPIEPTEEMMLAAEQAEDDFQNAEEGIWFGVKSYYMAMLAAAPEAKP